MAAAALRLALPRAAVGSRLLSQAAAAGTRITTLKNGLRVATETTPHTTATVGLFVDAGARFEDAKTNGTAHFLEHMAFKGSKKRTQLQLEQEVEQMGTHLNAFTSRENTVYYGRCFSSDVPKVTEILADIIQNPTLSDDAIERERSTILRESAEVNNQPLEVVFDHLHAVAYQHSPLGKTILGSDDNIKSITRADLQSYIKTHYTAPRIVLAAAGGVDHDALVKHAEQLFGGLPSVNSSPSLARCPFNGSQILSRDDSAAQANFAISVEGVGWGHPDFFPLMVASTIVGTWDVSNGAGVHKSSRLAREVASDGLAHSFMSFSTSYSDTGLWGIYAATPYDKIEDFVFATQAEWMRICTSATPAEVERAKTQLKANMLFQLDNTTAICEEIGRQVLSFGRRISVEELAASIQAVDASKVRAVATQYIFDKCPAVAAIGPVEQFPDYNRLRSGMFWMRT